MTIQMHFLSGITGHSDKTIKDDDPAERAKLAETVTEMIRLGHAVFVEYGNDTYRIVGYDSARNRWKVKPPNPQPATVKLPTEEPAPVIRRRGRPRKEVSSIPAARSRATFVPSIAGG